MTEILTSIEIIRPPIKFAYFDLGGVIFSFSGGLEAIAEKVNAIRSACRKLNSKDLSGVTLYSTCEPCPMCFSASWWAKISRIVFGVALEESSKLFGPEILVSADYLNRKGANKIEIKGGVLKEEVIKLYD